MTKNILITIWIFMLIAILGIFYIDDIDSRISIIGIASIIFAAFTSIMIAVMNNQQAREREYDLHLLKEKQKVCEHFYNLLFDSIKNIKTNKSMNEKQIMNEVLLFKKGLMNWGSKELIEKYIKYEDNLETNKSNVYAMSDNVNTFLKELRRELGFKDSKKLKLMDLILTAEARKESKHNKQS